MACFYGSSKKTVVLRNETNNSKRQCIVWKVLGSGIGREGREGKEGKEEK
jgi:hypothetical protein